MPGFAAVSLQPAAGAHGELTGVLIMRAYHASRGDTRRTKVLIPDSAHGTNPASSAMSGFEVVEVPSDARGNVDLEALRGICDETVVGLMLTNPNTLGLFEEHVVEVCEIDPRLRRPDVRRRRQPQRPAGRGPPRRPGLRRDALQPAQDLLHARTAAADPGSGPVGVSARLAPFLPGPIVAREGTATAGRRRSSPSGG